MSVSNDPANFFQTTASINESARKATKSKNSKGDPIKLPSKILAVARDPQDDGQVYVAEAAGTLKKIKLETSETVATFSGPTAPLTSLAISTTSGTVFAGCWDKTIWSWSTSSRRPRTRYLGHGDFVKAVLVLTVGGREVLVSGSQDASIIVWDAATGSKLHILKGHTRGVLALAVDPAEYDGRKDTVTIFSAGSDREIRQWSIGLSSASEVHQSMDAPSPIVNHETSIDSIFFDSDGDLWTASADKTVKCHSRLRNWEVDTSLTHPDFARDVVIDEDGGWVVTACRDEAVRVFEKGSGKLHHVFEGHFEEITGLLLLPGQKVVSVSIDATIRQWSLKAGDLAKAVEEAIKEAEDKELGREKEDEKAVSVEGLMTEEEERELAELMGDSD